MGGSDMDHAGTDRGDPASIVAGPPATRDADRQASPSSGDDVTRAAPPSRVLLIASGAAFLAFLDVTVVNLAFPDLQRDFPQVSLVNLSWVITAYAVLFAALMTPGGRFADVMGRRRLFLAGLAVFTTASAACAVAPDIVSLVVARGIQGGAAAALVPASLGLVLAAVPKERLSAAVGLWGAAAALAAAVGPTLGGLLVEAFNWRAVFVINVPIGLLILVAGRRSLTEVRSGAQRLPDPLGIAGIMVGVASMVLGVTKANEWGWGSTSTIACIAGGSLLVVLALLRSSRHPAPAVDTTLWRSRLFAVANITSLLFGAALYAWLLIMVLFLIAIWDYSPLVAGLAVTPGAVSAAVAAVVTGRLADKRGQRTAVVLGSLLLAGVGLWLVVALSETPQFLSIWLPAGTIAGAGMGMVLTGLSSAAAAAVTPQHFAAATGLNMTARQFGGALGIAALATILQAEISDGVSAFTDVFLFCAVLSICAAVSALWLSAPEGLSTPNAT